MRSLRANIHCRPTARLRKLTLNSEIPLLNVAVAKPMLTPRSSRTNRSPGRAAVRIGEADVWNAVGALVEAIAGEERSGERGVQDHVQQFHVPVQTVTAPDHRLRSKRSPGYAETR